MSPRECRARKERFLNRAKNHSFMVAARLRTPLMTHFLGSQSTPASDILLEKEEIMTRKFSKRGALRRALAGVAGGLSFLAVVPFAAAQNQLSAVCEARYDRKVYPAPAPSPLPPAGGVLIDPTFCTPILRVTDEKDGQHLQTAYSYWPTFNVDNTRIYVLQDDTGLSGVFYRFDADPFTISDKELVFIDPTPDGTIPSREDATWSATDPDVIFCHSKLNLWSYNVVTRQYTLLRDFKAELAEGHLKQMSRSIDDNTFAFTAANRRYRPVGSLAWRRDEDHAFIRPLDPEGLDEVQIDKTGRFLVIKTGAQGPTAIQVRIMDLDTGLVEDLLDGPPDYAPGHGDLGRGFIVGYENWKNRVLSRNLSEPHKFKTAFDMENDWTQDVHVSMLADNDRWVLYSLYTQDECETPGLFHNEIVRMSTNGDQVIRLAHHQSCVSEYWESPRANISRDGRFVAFTSNWGNPDRRDVFILRTDAVVRP